MSEDTIISLCFTGAMVLLFLFYVFFKLLDYVEDLEKIMGEEYLEYETPERLQKIWGVDEKVGVCTSCGLGDQPVLWYPNGHYRSLDICQWCAELKCLSSHLKDVGIRRYRSRA